MLNFIEHNYQLCTCKRKFTIEFGYLSDFLLKISKKICNFYENSVTIPLQPTVNFEPLESKRMQEILLYHQNKLHLNFFSNQLFLVHFCPSISVSEFLEEKKLLCRSYLWIQIESVIFFVVNEFRFFFDRPKK